MAAKVCEFPLRILQGFDKVVTLYYYVSGALVLLDDPVGKIVSKAGDDILVLDDLFTQPADGQVVLHLDPSTTAALDTSENYQWWFGGTDHVTGIKKLLVPISPCSVRVP